MTDSEREKLADYFRDLSLKVETATYEASMALKPGFIAELLEISARLCEAADTLEDKDSAALSLASKAESSALSRTGQSTSGKN